jgi:hypothetical protein
MEENKFVNVAWDDKEKRKGGEGEGNERNERVSEKEGKKQIPLISLAT